MRVGECNGCSACCRFLILQVNPAYLESDRRHWIELHGIRLYEKDGGTWAVINSPCEHLTEAGQCGIYGAPERPEACNTFPAFQHDIDLVDEWIGEKTCSYSFANSIQEITK